MAEVSVIYMPAGEGGRKQGADDYVASGHGVDDLLALATTELRVPPPEEEDQGLLVPYRSTPNGLVWDKPVQDGTVPVPLTNFDTRIVADVARDDGAEVQRSFEIEARLNNRHKRFGVPAAKFSGMGWHTEHLGASAIVYPGFSIKDHARAAIQMLSQEIEGRRIFAHTGWRKVDGVWLYLHGSGAIGPAEATEGFEVQLDGDLSLYSLPEPTEGEDLKKKAIRASLGIWEVAPDDLVIPQQAAACRTAMGESDFSIHVVGDTGEGKSEVAALFQQHFGARLDARHLTSWESTENALETRAHSLKDSLMVVDDFAPGGTSYDVQRWHRKADRIMRGKGNASGRERLRGDLTPRPARPPRALILSTGEDVPRGQSLRARMLILEHDRGAVDWSKLTCCQKDAREGLYARAMAGFVSWLSKDYEQLLKRLPDERQKLRETASRGGSEHMRTPGIVADLGLGLRYFLDFARDAGAITEDEADGLWERGWRAVTRAGASQSAHQGASDPTRRFRELLSAAITSGRAHVADAGGGEPEEIIQASGWRKRSVGTGDYAREEWQPQGDRVGWVKSEDLYLEPEASYRVVQAQAQGGESISVGAQTLRKRFKEKGLLLSTDEKRQTLTVRRTVEGVQRNVLHLGEDFLFSGYAEPDKPDTEDEKSHKNGDSGPDSVSGSSEGPLRPDIETDKLSGSNAACRVTNPEPDTGNRLSNAENASNCRVCRVFEDGGCGPNEGGVQADRQDRLAGFGEYELVTAAEGLDTLVRRLEEADTVAVDLETTGLNPRRDKVRLISLSTATGRMLVDCFEVDPRPLFLVLARRKLVFHNAAFDLGFLSAMGFELGEGGEVIDTMLISQLLEDKEAA